MAKRRKLELPSADDLSRYEDEFRRETPVSRPPTSAPIAQVAAETAAGYDARPPEARAEAARDRKDAVRLRDAEGRGLVMAEIPLEEIDADALVRDRVALDQVEMRELEKSILSNGLRLPIEVFEYPEAEAQAKGARFGLLSGYRRLRAVQALKGRAEDDRFDTIRAVIRDPDAMGGTFAAMVEENEIRASLSHFERGRIAVIASQQSAFPGVEAAVDALFPQASKAKRSKIRSFALIFEELGDMLTFPDLIKEKDGLKLAQALRDGAENKLRRSLAETVLDTPEEEAAALARALEDLDPPKADPRRGGRPKKAPKERRAGEMRLDSGVTLVSAEDERGWMIRLDGKQVDRELVEVVMAEVARLLDTP
ncbi:ParB N-terminal domain-containing protein [Chachezhania antarctica]|uniref:ParB N-terminal domain-containing protein n=1 Tax=Chachezhania antarctica TaxID=2340860 RepID=UPI000EADDCCD|nr:ParB N-terminal domain-containing protein [Chachezhania antarctica]